MAEEKPLSRWSRLKNEKRSQTAERSSVEIEEPTGGALPVAATLAETDEPEDAEVDLDVLAEQHDLPAVDTLNEESDFTRFMADGVPELLRKAALRKLWRSSPVFAVLDGLNDYDEDFNKIDTLLDVADSIAESKAKVSDPLDDSEDIDDGEDLIDEEAAQVPRQKDTSAEESDHPETQGETGQTPENGSG